MESTSPRPRRRRAPTRGLLFGAPLERVAPPAVARPRPGAIGIARTLGSTPDVVVPIAMIGESTPVAPPRVTAYGAMAASWPLVDRSEPVAVSAESLRLDRRRGDDGGGASPGLGAGAGREERRLGGLSGSEWDRMLGR